MEARAKNMVRAILGIALIFISFLSFSWAVYLIFKSDNVVSQNLPFQAPAAVSFEIKK